MSEDEAFIRAVVDNPGDDTPRLVYADWLDDRDDPRGSYLRAEMEWAKPWRSGKEPSADASLLRQAVPLDPVWVGRVSRPPVGVCCDHVRFAKAGPRLTDEDIDYAEGRLGVRFPLEFRALLLNFNGGVPTPAHLPYPPASGWDDMDMEIGGFYASSLGLPQPDATDEWEFPIESELDFLHELFENFGAAVPNPLLSGLVPVAHTIHDLGYLLVGVADGNRGRVFHFRDYCHFATDPDHLFQYADSVPQLLSILRPERDNQ